MGKTRLSTGKLDEIGQRMGLSAMRRASMVVVLAFLAVGFSGTPLVAWGHAALVKSSPVARAELRRSPTKIQLWFNEKLEGRFSSFSLLDAQGKPVALSAVTLESNDPKSMSANVDTLPPGRYTVKYRVLSTDGHVVENQFNFTVIQ